MGDLIDFEKHKKKRNEGRGNGQVEQRVMPTLWEKIIAKLKRKKLVCLEDHEKRQYISMAKEDEGGVISCPVYWGTNVGHCVLEKDGLVYGHYIQKWKWA